MKRRIRDTAFQDVWLQIPKAPAKCRQGSNGAKMWSKARNWSSTCQGKKTYCTVPAPPGAVPQKTPQSDDVWQPPIVHSFAIPTRHFVPLWGQDEGGHKTSAFDIVQLKSLAPHHRRPVQTRTPTIIQSSSNNPESIERQLRIERGLGRRF